MAISFSQYRYFCELAEAGSFGRAAARLNMSQPPLSRHIAMMEAELGTKLFERTPRGVDLTVAGRQLLSDAREILRLAELARRNVQEAFSGEAGELKFGFTMCAAYSVVPKLIGLFKETLPKVNLRAMEMMPTVLHSALVDGKIDVGISFADFGTPSIETQQLFREPMELALPVTHRLAKSAHVEIEELASERFISFPREQAPSMYDDIIARCRSAGFAPSIGLEVYLQQTIVNLVAEGLGIAFVPASMNKARVEGVVFKPFPNAPIVAQYVLWQSDNRNPCIQRFLEISKGLV